MTPFLVAALAVHLFCAGTPVPKDIFAAENARVTFLVDTVAEHKPGEWDLNPVNKLPDNTAMINFASETRAILGGVISVDTKDGVLQGDRRQHHLTVFSDIPAGYPPGQSCPKRIPVS